MTAQHTPGPWTANRRYVETDEATVCEVFGGNRADARLIAAAPELLEACQTFAEWLRREDAGFDHKTHNRETPEGEAAWREWFYGNIAICGLAQDQVRAAIAKATGDKHG